MKNKRYKADTKLMNSATALRKLCKCGHSQIVGKQDRVICKWCGHYIYKNEKIEFIYKVKEMRNNGRLYRKEM